MSGTLAAVRSERRRLTRLRKWLVRSHGRDSAPLELRRRRIYILPTPQGLVFALLVFTMLLGAMNYDNSMAYLLTFLLGGMGMATMHHAHRNLLGLSLLPLGAEPVFAGQEVHYRFRLHNPSRVNRYEVVLRLGARFSTPVDISPGQEAVVSVAVPARSRGELAFDTITVESRHPGQLFRVWSWAHLRITACVWPAPAAHGAAPPPGRRAQGEDGQGDGVGEEDFAGLREYHRGDAPRRIAWKAYARDGELKVKQFTGSAEAPPWLDLDEAGGGDLETRLAVLARWALDCHEAGLAFGLRLPGQTLGPATGRGQLERALTLMSSFDGARADAGG